MGFTILGTIWRIETIAAGRRIRERTRLERCYGPGRWRKRKGLAWVRLENGRVCTAEVHWYEATGIGCREFKLKRLVDPLP